VTTTVGFEPGAGFERFLACALEATFLGGPRFAFNSMPPTLAPDLATVGDAFNGRFSSVFLAAAAGFLAGSGADLTAFEA
jgi:hypothetical protein